jgi:hypothetical protein
VILDHLVATTRADPFSHVGIARTPAPAPYRWCWVVFLVDRLFALKPVPTSGEPGGTLPMLLRIDPRFTASKIIATWPRGEIHEAPVGMSGGWAVVSLPLANQVGRQWVELVGYGQMGPEVLALFPIEVGREPPRLWVGEARADESWIATVDQAEAVAVELVNRDRRRFGLPELPIDRSLSEIARSHSIEMASAGFFAHVSPTTGSIVDRLAAEGYEVRYAAENLAQSPFLADAQDGLMRSPGHRAAVLTKVATRMGLGVAITDGDGEGRVFHVTQIFVLAAEQEVNPSAVP